METRHLARHLLVCDELVSQVRQQKWKIARIYPFQMLLYLQEVDCLSHLVEMLEVDVIQKQQMMASLAH